MKPRAANLQEAGTVILILLVLIAAWIREPRFFEPTGVESVLLWIPLIAVVGMGQLMVIATRGIDVSVGSMVGLSAMVVGMLFRAHPGLNLALGTLAGVAVGAALGSLNGLLVAWARVPPIIATIGTLSAYRGLVFIVSRGVQVDSNYIPESLSDWSSKGPLTIRGVTIPWLLVVTLLVAIATAWFLRKTRTGRDIFALGSNPEAARLRGIPIARVTFLVYAVTGCLCGLAGLLYMARYGFVNPATAGQGMELMVIASVVIGGTPVSGGSGSVFGVLLGCLLLALVNVGLAVLGIGENWQQLVYGVVILIAVTIDALVRRFVARAG